MISDITIGQYYSGTSFIHRMDARMKFVLTMALIVILFVCRNFYSLALGLIFVVATLLLSKVPMKMMWRSIKPLVILMLFTAVINVFYNRGGETLVSFWKITITTTGVYTAIFTTVRIILLVVVSSLLTYTTTPTMLTDALERLLSPLKVIKSAGAYSRHDNDARPALYPRAYRGDRAHNERAESARSGS